MENIAVDNETHGAIGAEEAPAPEDQHNKLIRAAARDALDRANGDFEKATDYLEKHIHDDEVLFHAVVDPLVRIACSDILRGFTHQSRNRLFNGLNKETDSEGKIKALGAANFMMFQLPGGKPLENATKVEVMSGAHYYLKQAKTMTIRGHWLELVSKAMTNNKTRVADQFNNERLGALWEKAQLI